MIRSDKIQTGLSSTDVQNFTFDAATTPGQLKSYFGSDPTIAANMVMQIINNKPFFNQLRTGSNANGTWVELPVRIGANNMIVQFGGATVNSNYTTTHVEGTVVFPLLFPNLLNVAFVQPTSPISGNTGLTLSSIASNYTASSFKVAFDNGNITGQTMATSVSFNWIAIGS